MKRAPIVLAATAAGLGATLGFSPQSQTSTAATASAVTTTAAPTTSSSASSPSSSSSSTTKTATGSAASTRYGPIQLKVTISRGKITKIEPVQLPSSDPKSSEISSYAAPQLQQSALTKQSSNIDAVSGATYTSAGYKQALQSALDNAGFQSSTSSTASAQ